MTKIFAVAMVAVFVFSDRASLQAETPEERLQLATGEYEKSITKARTEFIDALEAEVKRAANTGNLDSTLAAKKEFQQFQESSKLPTSSRMKGATSTYRSASDKARKKLIEAYQMAIAEYTKGLDLEKAQATKRQMQLFESGSVASSSSSPPDDTGIPDGADTIPAVRQFLDARRAAEAAVAEQRERICLVLDQKLSAIENKSNPTDAESRREVLRAAKDKLEAEGVIPDLPEVQAVVRTTRSTVDAANIKADKAAERAIEVAKSRKSEELLNWLEAQRDRLGVTLNWTTAKAHVRYEHIEPNFSRAAYAPYIDEPPTRLLDAELKMKSGQVGWQNAKPNLIRFTFERDVQPKAIRLYFVGSEVDSEVGIPKAVTVYDATDPKTRRKLGRMTSNATTSTWLEVPLSGPGRTFVVDIEKTPAWTVLAEVEFR